MKKEKRKQLDQLHKLQAKSAAAKKGDSKATRSPDDLASESTATLQGLSESTTTLQGSTTHDSRRRNALPALLPDDILNAEPVTRLPTPPSAVESSDPSKKKPNKLRFLDQAAKPPKDIQMGYTTIRVLDENRKSKPSLAPKASKASRNSRDNWFKRDRCTAHVNGLRRTAGGPSGFVRR